jgi:enoyl-CoA hydratase
MSYKFLLFGVTPEGIATVVVNRPEKLNALNRELIGELDDAVRRIAGEPGVRAAIFTGAGEKAFVAGADISEFVGLSGAEMRDLALRGQGILRRLETMGKLSVAAVNGFALGGGLELALACSIRLASANARMGQPEVKLGLMPGYGGTQRLPRLVGRGRALEMLLTGEPIDAAEAYSIGLVNRVVEPAELMPTALALVHKVLANAPVAARLIMDAVDLGLQTSLENGLRFEATAFGLAAATADAQEGTRAFVEKRKPAYTGK